MSGTAARLGYLCMGALWCLQARALFRGQRRTEWGLWGSQTLVGLGGRVWGWGYPWAKLSPRWEGDTGLSDQQ